MDAPSVIFILAIIGIVVVAVSNAKEQKKERERVALLSPDEQQKYYEAKQLQLEENQRRAAEANKRNQEQFAAQQAINKFGPVNSAMVCPHCQTKGKVRTKSITQKKGVSGGKAAAAVVTGGLSVLAVGLSRKEASTQAHCDNCGSTWLF